MDKVLETSGSQLTGYIHKGMHLVPTLILNIQRILKKTVQPTRTGRSTHEVYRHKLINYWERNINNQLHESVSVLNAHLVNWKFHHLTREPHIKNSHINHNKLNHSRAICSDTQGINHVKKCINIRYAVFFTPYWHILLFTWTYGVSVLSHENQPTAPVVINVPRTK